MGSPTPRRPTKRRDKDKDHETHARVKYQRPYVLKGTHARSSSQCHRAAVSPTLEPQAHREPLAHPRRPSPIAAQEAHVLRAREAHQSAPGHLEHHPLPG